MDNPRDPEQPDPALQSTDEETVASLLRLAGLRAPVPSERYERVRLAVRAHWLETLRAGRPRRAILWIASSLAAAAALVLAVGLGVRREAGPSPAGLHREVRVEKVSGAVQALRAGGVSRDDLKAGDILRAGDELRTASDSRVALRLPGGASLRLDTASKAQLLSSSAFELHEGAVYVDTGSPSGVYPAIEIRTLLGRVTEVGTQFEVRLRGDTMGLRVRDGLVSLERGGRTYRAEAGQQLFAGGQGEVITREAPPHGEDWSWTLGIAPSFDLEGRSLQEFLFWVSAETGWRVEYEERSIADHAPQLILHGSIEGLRPDEAPGVVLPTCDLRHRVVEGVLIVGRLTGHQ